MSELANKARQRNWLLMRLIGAHSIFFNKVITIEEKVIMDNIKDQIKILIDNFGESSKQLGFKVKDKVEKQ